MIPLEWFELAQGRISSHVVKTPLTLDTRKGLYLKWENKQITGSFKARGALNKVLSLEDWERARGLVTASAGNHGQGVALAGQLSGCAVEVFVPEHAPRSKIEAMQALGATLHFVAGGYGEAEPAARDHARKKESTFVSPYNDGQVIAGQGTLAIEVLQQLASAAAWPAKSDGNAGIEIENWIVPTGGGGLISACGSVIRAVQGRPRLIGVQPEASAFTHSLYHRHTQAGVEDRPTLADGLSGPLEQDSVTIPMMRELVDDMVTVSEEAISRAIAYAWVVHGEKIEGSAAAALAAALDGAVEKRPSVVIISGGNIDEAVFEGIIAEHAGLPWN